ncbi:hypothetical protein [Shewanella algae]|uniref:hypothetical protein n=1 Tax=Shewanella TaxID=22 RepID=UPI003007E136
MHITDCNPHFVCNKLASLEQIALAGLMLHEQGQSVSAGCLFEQLQSELETCVSALKIYDAIVSQGGVGDAPTGDALSKPLLDSPEGSVTFSASQA